MAQAQSRDKSGRLPKSDQGRVTAKTPRGEITIITERCKGCGFCIEFCPRKVLKWSGCSNSKGYHTPHASSPDECIECRLCETMCPEFAIFTTGSGDGGQEETGG